MERKAAALVLFLGLAISFGAEGQVEKRLHGWVNPNGILPPSSTTAWFEWGLDLNYINVTHPMTDIGTGIVFVPYFFDIDGLECDTTYYMRAVAENDGGVEYSEGRNFTTSCSERIIDLEITGNT